eukprot:6182255-Pleurochrysis_carterae.AAC.4
MELAGALSVVHVCTDTCSVMRAAWRVVQNHFRWVTATWCGPHVLSLELKDIAKLPPIADVMSKVSAPPPQYCAIS